MRTTMESYVSADYFVNVLVQDIAKNAALKSDLKTGISLDQSWNDRILVRKSRVPSNVELSKRRHRHACKGCPCKRKSPTLNDDLLFPNYSLTASRLARVRSSSPPWKSARISAARVPLSLSLCLSLSLSVSVCVCVYLRLCVRLRAFGLSS
jgi:hypothetical protein